MRTVSAIIPTHDRRIDVRSAVRSACAQSYPLAEIVLVDNGSNPPVVASEFEAEMRAAPKTRLEIIRTPANQGAAAARQIGLGAAKGEFVAFLDSDDLWAPEKNAAQIALLERETERLVVAVCGWRRVLAKGRVDGARVPIADSGPGDFAAGCWFCPGSTMMARRAVFDLVGPFATDLQRLEDYEWFLRFAGKGGRVIVADIVGADIAIGGRGRVHAVFDAAAKIEARIGPMLPSESARRRMRAYLNLERAAAFRNEGRMAPMAWRLLRSWIEAPRLHAPLRNWWRKA